MNAAIIATVLNASAARARLAEQGAESVGDSPAEVKQFIASEVGKWKVLVRISGATVE